MQLPSQEPITVTGTVAEKPQVRWRFCERQQCHIPVLCLRLRVEAQGQSKGPIVMVQQPFPPNGTKGAHCAANRYRTGRTVTVSANLADLQLTMPNVQHIQMHPKGGSKHAQATQTP